MTNKLYEKNSYLKEIETVVTACENRDDQIWITLADTIFFPEEGGQYADTGLIKAGDQEVKVLDGAIVRETSDRTESITYKVDAAIQPGTAVTCFLDFDTRYERMQCHSGEHILTGVIHNRYGYDNVGFHLSDDGPITMDINGQLTYEQVIEMEAVANKVIYQNLPIIDSYPTKDELKDISYRSKIEIAGQVRLITIGEGASLVDVCACCAPHVARTGEVGIIKVISVVNWKGGVRISMLAGKRALDYINHEHDIIRSLTQTMTTSAENILSIYNSKLEEIGELKSKLSESLEEGLLSKIKSELEIEMDNDCDSQFVSGTLINPATNAANKAFFAFVDASYPPTSMKNVFNKMCDMCVGYVGIFSGDDESGYRYFAGSKTLDAKVLGEIFKNELSAKGGGNSDMIQGQMKVEREDIQDILV